MQDRCGGGDPIGANLDNLIAGPNPQPMHANVQGASSAAGAEAMAYFTPGCALSAISMRTM